MILSQVIVIAWFIAKICIHAINHGEQIKKPMLKYNVWANLISVAIEVIILYYGGFWDCLISR